MNYKHGQQMNQQQFSLRVWIAENIGKDKGNEVPF
jgi:hypothetical protein